MYMFAHRHKFVVKFPRQKRISVCLLPCTKSMTDPTVTSDHSDERDSTVEAYSFLSKMEQVE